MATHRRLVREAPMSGRAQFQSPLPAPTMQVFDRILTLGWYDGITSGLVCSPAAASAFRFDLLAWGPYQERRVFALSLIPVAVFEKAVRLLSRFEQPVWPRWDAVARWPSAPDEAAKLNRQLDGIIEADERPELVTETDSMFETMYAAKRVSGVALDLLPSRFDAYPSLDNFDFWHQYLDLQASSVSEVDGLCDE
jgi:hypothetical protein